MTKRLILVAGNIGAGKTSITEKLGDRLGWITGFESVTDNPYLSENQLYQVLNIENPA